MAENLYSLGFTTGGPSPQELDLLPTRIAQAAGVQKGTLAQATGAIDGILLPVQATALQASDAIQGAIDGALEQPRDAQLATYQTALVAIDEILAPLRSDAAKNQTAPPKRKRRSKSSPEAGPSDVQPVPPGLPPGCHWYQYPPGRSGPPRLVCPSAPPPSPVPQPPAPGGGIFPPPAPLQPPPPPAPPVALNWYWMAVNCQLMEGVAVPCPSSDVQAQLVAEGYCPTQVIPQWMQFLTPTIASDWLRSVLPSLQQYCAINPTDCVVPTEPLPPGDTCGPV